MAEGPRERQRHGRNRVSMTTATARGTGDRCPGCGRPFRDGMELPEGAAVHALKEQMGRLPHARRIGLQLQLTVSARRIRTLGLWALQDSQSLFVRPPCGNPGEIMVFQGPRSGPNARHAAQRWNERARS